MLCLKKKFQKEIFQKLIAKYGDSIKAAKIIKIPASSIRGYKNLYFESVPKNLLIKLMSLNILDKKDLTKNTIQVLNKFEIITKNLNFGREKRRKQFKIFRQNIPSLNKIIDKNYIYLDKWFNKYEKLVNSNFRKLKVLNKKDYLSLEYNNFTKNGYKNFKTEIPKKMPLNNELIYFLGLWCGDRSGGKRLGICNQNTNLLNFTEDFLKKYNQKIEKILYITKNVPEPIIKYDKKFVINKKIKGWVLSMHSNNGVFASFFYYLQSHLNELLNFVNKYPFFAGLFDAEGNVSLYNKSLRWACKNDKQIKIYSRNLKKLNLFERYDGRLIISYNVDEFYKKILPYMKHNNKKEMIKFLYNGKGNLPDNSIELLGLLKETPYMTQKEISKALKKNKVYSELGLLKKFGFISQRGYPYMYKINEKGLKPLGD